MKYSILSIFTALLLLASLSSCVKCETCTTLDSNGEVIYEAESCGRKSIRDEGRANCENMANAHGGTCGCVSGKLGDE